MVKFFNDNSTQDMTKIRNNQRTEKKEDEKNANVKLCVNTPSQWNCFIKFSSGFFLPFFYASFHNYKSSPKIGLQSQVSERMLLNMEWERQREGERKRRGTKDTASRKRNEAWIWIGSHVKNIDKTDINVCCCCCCCRFRQSEHLPYVRASLIACEIQRMN